MSGDIQIDDAKFEEALQTVLDRPKHDFSAIVGGMHVASGTDMVIGSGEDFRIIHRITSGEEVGTLFVGKRDESFDLKAYIE